MNKRVFPAAIAVLAVLTAATAALAATMIKIDGSSTVYLITEAVAEEFGKVNKNVQVTVGISGTGGGFKRFCVGETDIQDASRPIKKKEIDTCKANGVDFIELPVAYDGLSVVVNKKNTWCKSITVAELKKIWAPGSQVKKWSDIRPNWPDQPIKLYGPGTDSGTFEYFTEEIVGTSKSSRSDYTASEDDNVLVQGIAGDQYAMGYFGLAYYEENSDKLAVVALDDFNDSNGKGAVIPSATTVANGTYRPLSRPLFIYVKKKSASKPEVKQFVDFYLDHAKQLSKEVGYVQLPDSVYAKVKARWQAGTTGSVYENSTNTGKTLEQIYGG